MVHSYYCYYTARHRYKWDWGGGKAYAQAGQCEINTGDPHDFAGLNISFNSVNSSGVPQAPDYSNITIRVDTIAPSYSNSDGSFNSSGTGFYNLYNSSSGTRESGASFHPVPGQGGCGLGYNGYGIILTHSGTPDVNGNLWMLDCDYSYRAEFGGPQANPSKPFQEFNVYPTSNAPPNGLNGGGYWSASLTDPGNSRGEDTTTTGGGISNSNPQTVAPANGSTAKLTFTYNEPPQPPNNPINNPPAPSTGVSCTDVSFDAGPDVVVGGKSYPVQALLTMTGALVYSSTYLNGVINHPFTPATGDHTANIEPTSQSIALYGVIYYDDGGKIHYIDGTASSPALLGTAGPCYSATCTMSIDSGLPDNYIIPGRPFTVYATIVNNSVPYDTISPPEPLALPGNLGGPLQFQSNDGGYSNFAYGFPGGIASSPANSVANISFTTSVGGGGTMVGQMAYGGNFFFGSGCSVPLNIYPPPQVAIDSVDCAATVNGEAYDPAIPSASINVAAYIDGPAGTGTPLGPGSPGDPGNPALGILPSPGLGAGEYIADIPSAGDATVPAGNHGYSISIPAQYQDGQNHTIYVYALDPYGIENSAPSTITMTGCEEFHITPGSNGAALLEKLPDGTYIQTDEDPNYFGSTSGDVSETVTYNGNSFYGPNSSFAPNFPGVPVSSAPYTYTKNGAIIGGGQIPSPNGSGRFLDQNWAAPLIPVTVTTTSAGDVYCLDAGVIPTDGYIQNDGTILSESGGPDTQQNCQTVQNKPYFKVYGSGVYAGGSFSSIDSSCTGGGELGGWNNNDTGTYPASGDYGASSQFSAIAQGNILGFASAQTPNFERLPTDLSFANSVPGDISQDTYNPKLGGNFGSTQCFTSQTPLANATGLPSTNVGALPSGSYTETGDITLNAGQIGLGKNVSIFVKGNVYITGAPGSGITYQGAGGGWALTPTGSNPSNVPSFSLVVEGGSIYIDPNITELDGLYTAEPTSTTSPDGKIYTCAPGIGPIPSSFVDNMYSTCKNQLTVYGNFVADEVKLMRTFGSLRDDTPTPAVTTPTPAAPSEPPQRRPVPLYNYLCNRGSPTQYWVEGSGGDSTMGSGTSNCLPGGTSSGFDQNAPGTTDNIPCEVGSSSTYVYIGPSQNCPSGSSLATGSVVTTTTPAQPSTEASCSSSAGALRNMSLSPLTCAAEVFDFSPELYLSSPAIAPTNNGGVQPTAITSLPPVL